MPPKKDKELEGKCETIRLCSSEEDVVISICIALKCRRKKAQEKNDLLEEAKLCNAIGEVYMKKGKIASHSLHIFMYKEAVCV